MDKKRLERLSGKPIAQTLIAKLQRSRSGKLANLVKVMNRRAAEGDLGGFHPAHAAYFYTQNQVSFMSEQLTALKEMAPFSEVISRAEDVYMPSGPPMSPLTTSYFTCWAFFDACAGAANETIGTTVLEFGSAFRIDSELLRLIRLDAGLAEAGNTIWPFSKILSPALRTTPSFRPATRVRRASCGMCAYSRRQSRVAVSTLSSRHHISCCSQGLTTGWHTSAAHSRKRRTATIMSAI